MTDRHDDHSNARPSKRGDTIALTREDILAGTAAYPPDRQDDLLWLYGYACEQLHGSCSAVTEFVGVHWITIWKIWLGKYQAGIEQYADRVRHLRRKVELSQKTAFVETVITAKIMKVCDVARDQGCMVMVSGPSGRSKTITVREWQRVNNHGRTFYIYAPEAGGFRAFLETLGRAVNASPKAANFDLMRAVERGLDYRNVIIVDEVAHLMPRGRTNSIQALEFLRGLHDRTGCGVVLVCTELFPDEMAGGRWSRWFEQILGRVELHLKLPAEFSRREVADICSAYVQDPDPELCKTARQIANARRGGVRDLFRHLGRAAQAAARLGETLSARHLAAAYEYSKSLLDIPNA